jgi:hypothetical protein
LLTLVRLLLVSLLELHSFRLQHVGMFELVWISVNDPSAGSPTETLLRLLLPLSDLVYTTFPDDRSHRRSEGFTGPLEIGRSDGRCVQRAGT